MNNITHSILRSPNIGKIENLPILNHVTSIYISDLNVIDLLQNPSLDIKYIKYIVDTLSENMTFDIFNNLNNIHNKLIEGCLNSNNIHVKKYIINLLIDGDINDKLLKRFYKYYNVAPILFSKEELLCNIIDNQPKVILDYLFDYKNDPLSEQQFKYLLDKNNDYYINRSLAKNPSLSQEQIQYLLDKNNYDINRSLAQNSSLSEEQIQYLFDKNNYDINFYLAENPSLSKEQIQYLLDKNDYYINCYLAENPSLSKKQIQYLLNKNDYSINYNLTKNPSLSKEQIQYFLDKNYDINCSLSTNPSLSKEQIQYLFDKNNYDINCSLSTNPSLSKEQIQYLLDKNDDDINCSLSKNPSLSKGQCIKLIKYKPKALKNKIKIIYNLIQSI